MGAVADFSIGLRVYIEDTDAGGIVYYVNYLKFMERARTEFLRALGVPKAALVTDETLFVVHSANVRYRAPARLDDELTVTAKPVKVTPASLVFSQCVYRGDELLCDADIRIACVLQEGFRPGRMPAFIYSALSSLIEQGDPARE
ncbi:MAG: tol-pal system-associated acyl-CoA thioesterase [Gammaproteobacteria bacterium]|nr:MAG: tol-pal system-associated acyl-CoA thioesterase [Gammaproteobacteria bacterium]